MEIRYARNGDISIAYTVMGDGPVEMVFVPGFVGHLEIVFESPLAQSFFERLASFARVVVFDKRGFGLSDRGTGSYTVESVAEDMVAVLDAVGMERPAVFGVSEGGPGARCSPPPTRSEARRWSSTAPTPACPSRRTTRRAPAWRRCAVHRRLARQLGRAPTR